MIAYLNINSVRYKLNELKPVCEKLDPLVLCLAETKIDDSFKTAQFVLPGFHPPFRQDRTNRGGGLLAYVRADIPCRKLSFETKQVETISLELTLNNKKWGIILAYKPPKITNTEFLHEMEGLCERMTSLYENILLMGDLNFDLLDPNKSSALQDLMNLYDLQNLVTVPTFLHQNGSSLIDVALTPNKRQFCDSAVIDMPCSDGHALVVVTTRSYLPKPRPKTITYRSFKTFIAENFRRDISYVPFGVCDIFDDPSDALWAQSNLISEVLNEHAPVKTQTVRANRPPYMNRSLRKSIMDKTRLRNRFKRTNLKTDWEKYRVQRNKTTRLRRESIRNYFQERCQEGPKNQHFYNTIKPFLSNKYRNENNLMLSEGNDLLTKPEEVVECMNNFYVNIAKDIGNVKDDPKCSDFKNTENFVDAAIEHHKEHPSVTNILKDTKRENFTFSHITETEALKVIKDLNVKKATGTDAIPAKIIKLSGDILAPPFARLFNKCVDTSTFPDIAKRAEVAPIYKKDDALEKKNHRPVSVLTSSSKILENIMNHQMNEKWLNHIYHDSLSAFRAGYNCQHVLIGITEKWRDVREAKELPGLLLVDLSKAFDCLEHSLITAKLNAYGMDYKSTVLLTDYLSNRCQRVKLNNITSGWQNIPSGVPQGSILGPTVFNLFMNDVFYHMKSESSFLYNYADDNSVLVKGKTLNEVVTLIQNSAKNIIQWCTINRMEANPNKFQIMISGSSDMDITVNENVTITSERSVKLLGINLDNNLTYNEHVNTLIRKASRQLNCLKRIAYGLETKVKLLLYKSFVLSNFSYCPVVWHACGATNTKKLEKVQHRALKFVFKDYTSSYEDLLERAKLPTLELGRLRAIATEVYKAYNKLSPEYINSLFTPNTSRYNLRRRENVRLMTNRTTRHGLHSFRHTGGKIWNQLPQNLKEASDFKTFKFLIKTWTNNDSCECTFCRQ